jgi:hypothetical protein
VTAGRVLALPLLLVTLAVGGYLYAQSAQSNGPTSTAGAQVIGQAQDAVAATNLQAAVAAMQASFTQAGTYAGAVLPPGSGAVLVRADATSFCCKPGPST